MASSAPSAAPDGGVTHRRVLRLAVPIILANIGQPLLGAVDTAVMGHLPSPAYIGGVAVGALIFSFLYWAFGFLRMATTGFVAQARGAGDHQEIRDVALRTALLAAALGLAIVALQAPAQWFAFWAVEATPRVEGLAGAYFDIRVWGAPAALLVYVCIGWLIGMERTGTVLALTVYMNGLNIALDLLFVPVFGWGIEGVALATLIAEVSTAAIGLAVVARLHRPLRGRWRLRRLFADRSRTAGLLRANADIFLRTLCLIFGFAWFTAQGAKLGETVLAANAVLFHFFLLIGHGLDGFAFAAEALVGGAIGGRNRVQYRAAARLTTLWAGIVAACFALAYLAAGGLVIDTLTDIGRCARRPGSTCPGPSRSRSPACGASSSTASSSARPGPGKCATAWRWRSPSTLPPAMRCSASGATTGCGCRSMSSCSPGRPFCCSGCRASPRPSRRAFRDGASAPPQRPPQDEAERVEPKYLFILRRG